MTEENLYETPHPLLVKRIQEGNTSAIYIGIRRWPHVVSSDGCDILSAIIGALLNKIVDLEEKLKTHSHHFDPRNLTTDR